MSKFKVGDRVVRISNFKHRPHSPDWEVGKVHTVTGVSGDGRWINVDHPYIGFRNFPFDPGFFRLAKYSEYFTEPAKAEPTTGHVADSPIQKHSKGEFYPLCVVGYGDSNRVAYTIENLETGEVMAFAPGEFKGVSNIRAWGSAQHAYSWLNENHLSIKAGAYKQIKGRPTFIKNGLGLEIVVPPKHKRWAVMLDKVDFNKDTVLLNGVYYQALEQDIG